MEQRGGGGGQSLSALDTLVNGLSPEEAFDRVRSLTQDNVQLRETTSQLNLWLHTACDRITSLQDRLDTEVKQQQERCQSTREAISALQLTVTHKDAKIAMLIEQIQETNKLLDQSSTPGSSLTPELSTLQKQKNDLERKLEESRSQMDLLSAQLRERTSVNSAHVRANDAAKKTQHELQMEVNTLKSDKEISLRNQAQLNERLRASEQVVSTLRAQLSTQPTEKQSNHHDVQTLREQVKSLMAEVHQKDLAMTRINKLYEEAEMRQEATQRQLQETREEDDQLIQTLRGRTKTLEESLSNSKTSAQANSVQHLGMQQKYNQICSDYHKLLQQYETNRNENTQLRTSQLELREKVDNLTAQLMSAEEAMTTRDRLLRDLKAEQMKWKNDREYIELHQTQAEVYKQDFLAEKEARTKAEVDIDKLKEQNLQLREEITRLRTDLPHITLPPSSNYGNSLIRQASAMQPQTSYNQEGSQPLSYPPNIPSYAPSQTYHPPPSDNWLRDMGSMLTGTPEHGKHPVNSLHQEPRLNVMPGNTGPVHGMPMQYNTNHNAARIPQEQSSAQPVSKCPGCQQRFDDIKMLTEHVNLCLGLDTT